MATNIKRNEQGQLVESEGPTTDQLAQMQGVPVTPTTPAGVQDLGATPDQAKMAGTPAQKNAAQTTPVITDDTTKPQDTLQTAERTKDASAVSPTDADQAASAKADKIQSLGSLSTRVQALINQDLTPTTPAKVGASDTQIQTLPLERQAQARSAIESVIANPTDPKTLAAATQMWIDNGWGDVNSFSPDKFIQTAQEALGGDAQSSFTQATGGAITMDKVVQDPNEVAQLTDAFGGDSWKGMTAPQLSQRIEEMRQKEYGRIQGLQAQLSTATGAQRQDILNQLSQAGAEGVAGTEAKVADIKQAVDRGDQVSIGGQQYKVEDLLKDQAVSDLVTRMLGDKDLAAKVSQSSPEFAKWVTDNQASLSALTSTAAKTMGQVQDVDKQNKAIADVGNGNRLSDKIMSQVIPEWGKVTGSAYDTSKVGFLNLLKDPSTDPAVQQGVANALEKHSSDPNLIKQLAGMDAQGVQKAYTDAQSVQSDASGLASKLTGIDTTDDFVTNPDQQAALAKYQPVLSAIDNLMSQPGMSGAVEDPKLQPMLLDLIKQGAFTADDAALLAKDPTKLQTYHDYHESYTTMQTALKSGDSATALKAVFGGSSPADIDAINQEYAKAKQVYQLEPDSDTGKRYLEMQTYLDPKNTGHVDLAAVAQQAGFTGNESSLEDLLNDKGGPNQQYLSKVQKDHLDTTITDTSKDDFFTKMQSLLKDPNHSLTYEDLMSLDVPGQNGGDPKSPDDVNLADRPHAAAVLSNPNFTGRLSSSVKDAAHVAQTAARVADNKGYTQAQNSLQNASSSNFGDQYNSVVAAGNNGQLSSTQITSIGNYISGIRSTMLNAKPTGSGLQLMKNELDHMQNLLANDAKVKQQAQAAADAAKQKADNDKLRHMVNADGTQKLQNFMYGK